MRRSSRTPRVRDRVPEALGTRQGKEGRRRDEDLDRALELNPVQAGPAEEGAAQEVKCDVEGARSDLDALLAAKPGHKTALKERSTQRPSRSAWPR